MNIKNCSLYILLTATYQNRKNHTYIGTNVLHKKYSNFATDFNKNARFRGNFAEDYIHICWAK